MKIVIYRWMIRNWWGESKVPTPKYRNKVPASKVLELEVEF